MVIIVIKKIKVERIVCHLISVMDIRISPSKFKVGGALMFAIVNINHQNVKLGFVIILLFKDTMFRV